MTKRITRFIPISQLSSPNLTVTNMTHHEQPHPANTNRGMLTRAVEIDTRKNGNHNPAKFRIRGNMCTPCRRRSDSVRNRLVPETGVQWFFFGKGPKFVVTLGALPGWAWRRN
jgi:hypothetical protein